MSDAENVKLYYVEESTWATTPNSALKTFANPRSITLAETTGTVVPTPLRGDYIRPVIIRTKRDGSGELPFYLAYGDSDDFFEGAFRGDWSASITTTASDIQAVGATSKFTRAAGSWVTDGFLVGYWVKVSGFVDAGTNINGYHKITAVSAADLTVASTIGTEAAGASVTFKNSGVLRNGTVKKSYTLEKYFSDLSGTNPYHASKGMRIGGASLEWQLEQPVQGTFSGLMGKPPVVGAASAGNGSFTAAPTTRILDGVDQIYAITEGGTAVTVDVTLLRWQFNGGLETTHKLGNAGLPTGVGFNGVSGTGAVSMYWSAAAEAIYVKRQGFTATSLSWRATDPAGNSYIFTLPALRYTAGDPNATGPDTRNYLELEFGIEYDSTTSTLVQIDRFAA